MKSSLILGGVKSGKSVLAEQLASKSGLSVTYIATASANDDEMVTRIKVHQQRRPSQWTTSESALYLAADIRKNDGKNQCIIVDCLTLWLTNLLMKDDQQLLHQQIDLLVDCIDDLAGKLIMVSNESNMGIMPLGELTRRYCDEIGILHQRLAQKCDRVILTVAGLPHVLKGEFDD